MASTRRARVANRCPGTHRIPYGTLISAVLTYALASQGSALAASVASVLDVLPADVQMVVHVRNLRQLSDDVDALVAGVLSQEPPPTDMLAKGLAAAVGAGFGSVEELAQIGFDIEKDFAITLRTADPSSLTAVIHVSDADAVLAVIGAHQETEAVEYEGVTYWTGHEGALAFLEDLFVYSRSSAGVTRVIDVFQGRSTAIAASERYHAAVTTSISGATGPTLYVDVTALAPALASMAPAPDGPHGAGRAQGILTMAEGIDTLGLIVALDPSVPAWEMNIQFQKEGPWYDQPAVPNALLRGFADVPGDAFLVSSSMFSTDAMKHGAGIDQAPTDNEIARVVTDLLREAFADVPAGYIGNALMAVRIHDSVIPDVAFRLPLHDLDVAGFGPAITQLFDRLAAAINEIDDGKTSVTTLEEEIEFSWGTATGHVIPLGELMMAMPPQAKGILPDRIGLWRAVKDDELLVALGSSVEALNWIATGVGEDGESAASTIPARLRERLPYEATSLMFVSPILAAQTIVATLTKSIREMQVANALVKYLPSGHGIGLATTMRPGGATVRGALDTQALAPLIELAASFIAMQHGQGQAEARRLPEAMSPEIATEFEPQAAPELTLTGLDGEEVSLEDFAGRVVLLNFWATWVPPCATEMPTLQSLQDDYGDRGLVVLGVSVDDSGPTILRGFLSELGITYPIVLGNLEVQEALGGVPVLPSTLVIRPDGWITARFDGNQDYGTFEAAVLEVLEPEGEPTESGSNILK